jgi:hypothetical protein
LFDSTTANAESSFEVYFTLLGDKSERTYNYDSCINKEGVTEEWLNSRAKTARRYSTVFYRGTTDEELGLSGFPKSSRDNIRVALEKQVLIISLGAKLKIGKCKAIRDWFLANEFADFGDPFTNSFMSRRLPKGFVEDKNVQQKIVEYFASFDEYIKDFRIEKVPQKAESKEERYKINALHKMIDSDEMEEIPLGLESAGTLKVFVLYPKLQEVLDKCSVFFIDELTDYDAQYRIPWIVFDRDQVQGFDEIIEEAASKGIQVGWSNSCFEIWMYVYFGSMPTIQDSWTCYSEFGRVYETKTGQKYSKTMENCVKPGMKKGQFR